MSFFSADAIVKLLFGMKRTIGFLNYTVSVLLLSLPISGEAKGYSSGGGRSYSSSSSRSSSSSHSSSSGGSRSASSSSSANRSSGSSPSRSSSSESGSRSFTSSAGKSYGSGATSRESSPKTYTSAKSYTSDSDHTFSSSAGTTHPAHAAAPKMDSPSSGFSFDTSAARARKEEASRRDFNRSKEAAVPKPSESGSGSSRVPPVIRPGGSESPDPAGSYRVKPPPLLPSATGSYGRRVYVPDATTYATRSIRTRTFFAPYAWRPVVVYRDPYNSFFWWWLLDRSLDDRAYWAYHHRYDMDPARYQALVADNQELRSRVDQLEEQQLPRNTNYVPPGLDRDLMYSDQQVAQAYHNRPTKSGTAAFWALAIPTGLAIGSFFIWLIFFKRWQTAT